MENQKGHCQHGEFDLREGCQKCILERRNAEAWAKLPEGTRAACEEIAEYEKDTAVEPQLRELEDGLNSEGLTLSQSMDAEVNSPDNIARRIKAAEEAVKGKQGIELAMVEMEKAFEKLEEVEANQSTALIKVGVGQDPRVLALYNEGIKLRDFAVARTIKGNDDLVPATNDLAVIAKTKKAIEECRRVYTDPIRGHLDAVNAAFKEFTEPLVAADTINRDKIKEYRATVARKILEAEETNRMAQEVARRQAEQSGTGEFTVDITPVSIPEDAQRRVHTEMGSTSTQKIYKWELVDLLQVPAQYLMLNTALIGQVVKASKGSIIIPGVRIYEEETIRVNTR